MFEISSFWPPPNLGWEYPIELGTNQVFDYNFNLDSAFLVEFASSQAKIYQNQEFDYLIKRRESPQGTSSTDHFDNNNNPISTKKLTHNASERFRRKKISNLYSSLRALLPKTDHKKKLSIPATVVRVVEYITELQKEVENLISKKEELLSKISSIQGIAGEFIQVGKQNKSRTMETTSYSVATNKLGDKEMVIQISAIERISLSNVILLLEKNSYVILNISSFQSFGGQTFYNIHLWMEGSYTTNSNYVKEALLSLLQEQEQEQEQEQGQGQGQMQMQKQNSVSY